MTSSTVMAVIPRTSGSGCGPIGMGMMLGVTTNVMAEAPQSHIGSGFSASLTRTVRCQALVGAKADLTTSCWLTHKSDVHSLVNIP
ncbi:hypothetical protein ACFWFU_04275 [Streptomyces sp. NPDC060235]|uniref:hypothetical protein n=1 Tax=Streptomyces sp. NPDC060235 TaxID=3347080 RepID=UPI00364799A5